MSVTINGKKTALDDLPADTLVPRGAPVSITVKYDNVDHALENLGAFSFTKTVKGNMQDKEQSYDFYVEVDGKPFNGNAAITQKDPEKSDDADTQDKTEEDKSENTAETHCGRNVYTCRGYCTKRL